MLTVVYVCPFVPPEWIAAHGLRPERIIPGLGACAAGGGSMPASAGVCPYARSFVNAAAVADRQADAVVFTTVCDQMRRAAEVFSTLSDRPVFLMNVPSTWQTPAAMQLYVDELRRLGRFLARLGGKAPNDEQLAAVMLAYDADRAAHRFPLRVSASPRLRVFPDAAAASVPLAVVGGPLAAGQEELLDMIEQFGGHVVLDATEGGELTLPPPLEVPRVHQDPLAAERRAVRLARGPAHRAGRPRDSAAPLAVVRPVARRAGPAEAVVPRARAGPGGR